MEKDESWSCILAAVVFKKWTTANMLKFYSMGKLVIGRDRSILITKMLDWELIHHKKQTQIDKNNIRKNSKIFDYN